MDSSSQLTIAYDMLYHVKLAALSIKTILLFKNTPIHHKKYYNWNRESESILNIL